MKFLFVGLGSIGQRHLRNLQALLGQQAEFLAFRSRGIHRVITESMDVLEGVRLEEHYSLRVFHNLDEALSERPTAVFITNPTALHIPIALKAAEAGCHLFIEKPLSHSLEGVEELRGKVQEKGLVAMVGYQFRFHPCLQEVKRLLEGGAVGRPLLARLEIGEYLPDWHPYEDYKESYAARKNLGGGVVLTQSHEIDLVLWWFGMPEKVFALGGKWSDLEIDVEDLASVLIECRLGGSPIAVHLQMDYLQKPSVRSYKIVGQRGKIIADPLRNLVKLETLRGEERYYKVGGVQRNTLFLKEVWTFLRCLREGKRPPVNLEEGVKSLRIARAILKSMEKGEAVSLDG